MIITCIIVYVVTVLLYLGVLKYCKKALEEGDTNIDNVKAFTFIPVINTIGLVLLVVMLLVENSKGISIKIVDKLIGEDDD